MNYFAYGSNLNARAVAEWSRHHGHRAPALRKSKAVVLDNYRLCFPIFSEYWGGGIGDIEYDPGKYVMGALFEVTAAELEVLDKKVGRVLDAQGRETGTYKHMPVTVSPIGRGLAVQAVTYQGTNAEKNHIPPTQFYMDSVIDGSYQAGLSMMWISYLKSFSTQVGKKPQAGRG